MFHTALKDERDIQLQRVKSPQTPFFFVQLPSASTLFRGMSQSNPLCLRLVHTKKAAWRLPIIQGDRLFLIDFKSLRTVLATSTRTYYVNM